jgi:exodeoxyribonuclease-1
LPRRQEIVASLSAPHLRQLGRRLLAFHSPARLNAEETTRFNAYLGEKWSADDVPETAWMTVAKARVVIEALRSLIVPQSLRE